MREEGAEVAARQIWSRISGGRESRREGWGVDNAPSGERLEVLRGVERGYHRYLVLYADVSSFQRAVERWHLSDS